MEDETYIQLQSILLKFPYIHAFLDDDFIRTQCESDLKNHLLQRLNNKKSSHNTQRHLPTLEKRLAELASVSGYDRLAPLLRRASDWDQYQEALSQVDITLWFKHKSLLKEIEPELPHRNGKADILLSFYQQDIYCECTSFQSIAKSMESEADIRGAKIQREMERLRKGHPWLTTEDVKEQIALRRATTNLLRKTKDQLPLYHPGILALDATKSGKFAFDVRLIAGRLFLQSPQLVLIALWSWEGSGDDCLTWDMIPNHFFINPNSNFRRVGEVLLDSLGLIGEVVS